MRIFLYSILFSVLSALILIFPATFGMADLLPFVIWSLPFALTITLITRLQIRYLGNSPWMIKVFFPAVLSIAMAYAWSWFAYSILGVWILAFSLPLFPSWTLGGFAAMLSRLFFDLPQKFRIALPVLGIIGLLISLNITPDPDNIIITFVEWQEAGTTSLVDEHDILSEKQREEILNSVERGRFVVLRQSFHGLPPYTHMIVIVYSHMEAYVELPLPRKGIVVYQIDKSGKFMFFPKDAEFFDRKLLLEIFSDSKTNSDYTIQLPYGAMTGALHLIGKIDIPDCSSFLACCALSLPL